MQKYAKVCKEIGQKGAKNWRKYGRNMQKGAEK